MPRNATELAIADRGFLLRVSPAAASIRAMTSRAPTPLHESPLNFTSRKVVPWRFQSLCTITSARSLANWANVFCRPIRRCTARTTKYLHASPLCYERRSRHKPSPRSSDWRTSATVFSSATGADRTCLVFTILPGAAPQVKAAESQVQLTKKQAKALAATAKTPEDHMTFARYFDREANRLEAESSRHEELAKEYRNSSISQAMAMKNPMGPRTAAHCEFLAKSTRQASQTARELAVAHQQMAKDATK